MNMIKYSTKLYIIEFNYKGKDITVEYNFTKAELGYLNGTGTFDGVEIVKVLVDNTDVTRLLHYDFIREIENITKEKHLN